MTDNRPTVCVETVYSYEINSLTLTRKDVPPHENPFYIQLIKFAGGHIRLQVKIEDGEFTEVSVGKKEFMLLQDSIREVLDNPGQAKIINLAGNKIHILHFENNEIGFGIGTNKYLLQSDEATLLREFCLRVI